MGCCLGCMACDAAACLCKGACNCCGRAVPMSKIAGRVAYTIVFFVVSFISWIFRGWAKNILNWVPQIKKFCAGDKEEVCYGTLAVYRISFCLALFHLIMAAIMIGVKRKGDCRVQLQDGFWCIKIPVLVAACIGAFFVPNEVFEVFGWIELGASALFIVIQLVILVDFAHSWAENWIRKNEEAEVAEDKRWWWALLGSTLLMIAFSAILTVLMFVFFGTEDAEKCQTNMAIVIVNLILCFVICATSISPRVQEVRQSSGLLQPALISAYTTYLIWSALMSGDTCNPWRKSAAGTQVSVLLGALFTILAVIYATIRTAQQIGQQEELHKPSDEETQPLTGTKDEESVNKDKKEEEKEEKEKEEDEKEMRKDEPVAYHFSRYHLVFALGAMYLAMLMTDWHTVYNPGSDLATVDTGLAALWVKTVSSWLCHGIFMWTLVAPLLFPDRDWS